MFSTSMTASSTTSPIAIARPPSVIVLSVIPIRSRSTMPARSESGIAVHEMAAVRTSKRKTRRTSTTSTAPRTSEVRMFRVAVLMKLAARKRSG